MISTTPSVTQTIVTAPQLGTVVLLPVVTVTPFSVRGVSLPLARTVHDIPALTSASINAIPASALR